MSTSVVHDSMDSGTNFVNTKVCCIQHLLYIINRLKRIQREKTSLESGNKFDCVLYLASLEESMFS